jgi:hypothetical protein
MHRWVRITLAADRDLCIISFIMLKHFQGKTSTQWQNVLAMGNPARVIRQLNDGEQAVPSMGERP